MSDKDTVKPEVLKKFTARCTNIRTFKDEYTLTISFAEIINFYVQHVGIHPVIQTWEEIQRCIIHAIDEAKARKPSELPFVIRLTAHAPTWLAIKIYGEIMFRCDRVLYIGDTVIPI